MQHKREYTDGPVCTYRNLVYDKDGSTNKWEKDDLFSWCFTKKKFLSYIVHKGEFPVN